MFHGSQFLSWGNISCSVMSKSFCDFFVRPWWQGGPCWWQTTSQSDQNQFKISKPKSSIAHFCGLSKTAQCSFSLSWYEDLSLTEPGQSTRELEWVVMWQSLWCLSELGGCAWCVCVCIHIYDTSYAPAVSCTSWRTFWAGAQPASCVFRRFSLRTKIRGWLFHAGQSCSRSCGGARGL